MSQGEADYVVDTITALRAEVERLSHQDRVMVGEYNAALAEVERLAQAYFNEGVTAASLRERVAELEGALEKIRVITYQDSPIGPEDRFVMGVHELARAALNAGSRR